jgi:nucleoside-diphosphate-sugar epimerase
LPATARWVEAGRQPVLLDCARAKRELRWRPKHTSAETLAATVAAARADREAGVEA